MTRAFKIHRMDCAEEITALRRTVGPLVGGDDNLSFNLLKGQMLVEADASVADAAIVDAVGRTGMSAVPWQDREAATTSEGFWARRGREALCLTSGVLLVAGFAAHVGGAGSVAAAFGVGGSGSHVTPPLAVVLYVIAVLAGGWFVLPKAVLATRALRADMNVLMAVAVLGAMLIGEWFEAAAVTFLFSLALLLESWSVQRARRAIKSLLDLSPAIARVIDSDSREIAERSIDDVPVGATVSVRPGENIPLDGEITHGVTTVNQAPITGRSAPVEKSPGDDVYAGTLNGDGAIEVLCTKLAADLTVARIIHMVEEAQARRSAREQWVETFARYYTPLMMGAAVLVAVVPPLVLGDPWMSWIYQALAILVIACPCALVISTPVSVVAGLASAAKRGVLIKGGRFLEMPAQWKALAIDKTGTLTLGQPTVSDVIPMSGHTETELLEIAAAIEARSEHPLAKAIVSHATSKGISPQPADDYQAVQGKGATAVLDGRRVWVGSHRYLDERAQETPELHERLEDLSASGASVVVIGNDEHVCGFISIADAIRPEAREAVTGLRAAGIAPIVMLTGDNQGTAEIVAADTGVDEVQAELLPEDKLAAVDALMASYDTVAMVGDGINDAPAMARASMGIAMGAAGSDAAIETADIALMSDDLTRLPWLVDHSRRTLRIIKQNITVSIAVKALFVALAVLGHATLWAAIGADMGVSLLVVFNALRLVRAVEVPIHVELVTQEGET